MYVIITIETPTDKVIDALKQLQAACPEAVLGRIEADEETDHIDSVQAVAKCLSFDTIDWI
jgi:hypothetical protein